MRRYAVIGLGQFGTQAALSLGGLGVEVLAIDNDERRIDTDRDGVDPAAVLDATDESALAAAGIAEMDTVVVAMGNLAASVMITAILVKLGVRRIVARAASDLQERILVAVGAHKVVNPEKDFALSLMQELEAPNMKTRLVMDAGHRVVDIEAHQSLWGKTLAELDFRNRYMLNVIAIRRRRADVGPHGEIRFEVETNGLPSGTDRIEKGDVLVVLGSQRSLAALDEEAQ